MNVKPKIALLHGWAASSEYWLPVSRDLESAGYSVRRHDLPGYGSRQQEDGVLDLAGLVDDAIVRLADCDLWVGWSLGAMTAMSAAARKPGFLRGLVAVSPTAKFCRDADKDAALEQLRSAVEDSPKKAVFRFGLSMFPSESRKAFSKQLPKASFDEDPTATLLSGLEVLKEADLSDDLNKIDVPVQLISGVHDSIIPASSGQELGSLIPKSRYTALPCGHVPFWECREQFMEILFEFAEAISTSPTS